jgi:hypothetical protein
MRPFVVRLVGVNKETEPVAVRVAKMAVASAALNAGGWPMRELICVRRFPAGYATEWDLEVTIDVPIMGKEWVLLKLEQERVQAIVS